MSEEVELDTPRADSESGATHSGSSSGQVDTSQDRLQRLVSKV